MKVDLKHCDEEGRPHGPAIPRDFGNTIWYKHGLRHRIDGPALINENGHTGWWVEGDRCWNNEEYQKAANLTDEEMIVVVLMHGNVTNFRGVF